MLDGRVHSLGASRQGLKILAAAKKGGCPQLFIPLPEDFEPRERSKAFLTLWIKKISAGSRSVKIFRLRISLPFEKLTL